MRPPDELLTMLLKSNNKIGDVPALSAESVLVELLL